MLLQEMIHNGEKAVEETHDEKKINVNHDFMNSRIEDPPYSKDGYEEFRWQRSRNMDTTDGAIFGSQ